MSWVYIESEHNLYTVGFYDPAGVWHSDSDHSDREEAATRVHYLNGGEGAPRPAAGHNRGDKGRMELSQMLKLYTSDNCTTCDGCPLNAIADGKIEGQAFMQANGKPHRICTLFDYLNVNRPPVGSG